MHHTQQAIIIGGGIAGCSTAYALAKRGITVTLIERHAAVAQEASGNPIGILYPKLNMGTDPLSTIASLGCTFSIALLKQLANHQHFFQRCGQIQLAFNAREQAKQAKLPSSPQQAPFRLVSASEASEIAHIALEQGGVYLPESGWVKPQQFCQALTQAPNIQQRLTTQALTINQQADGWQVVLTNEEALRADIVVLCNANDIQQFGPCQHIPITPVRGQVNFFEANAASQPLQTVICSDHYLSPSVDGLHAIGTSYGPNDLNPAISAQDTEDNLHALAQISPTIHAQVEPSTVTARVAWRSATHDHMPLAGQMIDETALKQAPPRYNAAPNSLPWLAGLYVNAGHGSKGMVTAPVCAELIANLISKTPLPLPHDTAAKLNPSRFLLKDMGRKKIAQNLYDF